MAQGWNRVEQQAAESAEQRKRFAEQNKPQLFLGDGQSAIARFLEQGPEVHNYAVHEYRNSQGKFRTFVCLNDKEDGSRCPGCEAGMKRKLKGVYNIIQRNRPVYRKGQDGRAMKDANDNYIVDGHRDEIVILTVPSTTAEMLRQKDSKYEGLMSRDLEVSKTGTQFSPYVVEPADVNTGPVPMSDADQALVAQGKHNLDEFMKSPPFQEAAQIVARYGGQGPQNGGGAPPASQPAGGGGEAAPADPDNPFMGELQQPAQQ